MEVYKLKLRLCSLGAACNLNLNSKTNEVLILGHFSREAIGSTTVSKSGCADSCSTLCCISGSDNNIVHTVDILNGESRNGTGEFTKVTGELFNAVFNIKSVVSTLVLNACIRITSGSNNSDLCFGVTDVTGHNLILGVSVKLGEDTGCIPISTADRILLTCNNLNLNGVDSYFNSLSIYKTLCNKACRGSVCLACISCIYGVSLTVLKTVKGVLGAEVSSVDRVLNAVLSLNSEAIFGGAL